MVGHGSKPELLSNRDSLTGPGVIDAFFDSWLPVIANEVRRLARGAEYAASMHQEVVSKDGLSRPRGKRRHGQAQRRRQKDRGASRAAGGGEKIQNGAPPEEAGPHLSRSRRCGPPAASGNDSPIDAARAASRMNSQSGRPPPPPASRMTTFGAVP